MTKLTDTQTIILSAASQRPGNVALPLPKSLRGGAAKKVVGALIANGFLAEVPFDRPSFNADDDVAWGVDPDTTLVATPAGLEAIGIEPEGAAEGAQDAPNADPAATTAAEGDSPAPAAPSAQDGAKAPKTRANSKQAQLIGMLRQPGGASIDEIATATGWQKHTVRGAIAGALKKKLGLDVRSEKVEGRGTVYTLPAEG